MGSIDIGGQLISFVYKQPGRAETFNKLNYRLQPPGIYHGGVLTKVNDTQITISPLICYFEDSINKLGVRIETTVNANLVVSSTNNYIVLRYNWLNAVNNYMDILALEFSNIQSSDLIVGRLIYNGSTLSTIFDYSRKNWSSSFYKKILNIDPPFKVIANEPYDNKVTILPGGPLFFNGEIIEKLTSTLSNAFTLPVSASGRIDYVCITKDNNFVILEGVDSTAPVVPNVYFPIAKITFPPNATVVQGSYITYIHPSSYMSSNTLPMTSEKTGLTLASRDANGNFKSSDPVHDDHVVNKIYQDTATTNLQNQIDSLQNQIDSIYDGTKLTVPIGFIYIQFPSQSNPSAIFNGTWSNVSATYAGAFFRAEGGNASTFEGGAQDSQNLIHNHGGLTGSMNRNNPHNHSYVAPLNASGVDLGGNVRSISETGASTSSTDINHEHAIASDGGVEARPYNFSVRLWKRIS